MPWLVCVPCCRGGVLLASPNSALVVATQTRFADQPVCRSDRMHQICVSILFFAREQG